MVYKGEKLKMGNEIKLLTIHEFAEKAGVSVQAVYKRLNNKLNPYIQIVEGRKMLESSALKDIYGIESETFVQPSDQSDLLEKNVNDENSEVIFLRKQVEKLQEDLERERQHNREKDRQLMETLSKLAESQSALIAGQTAEKQKQLAEKIIEGKQNMEMDAEPNNEKRHWWSFFKK